MMFMRISILKRGMSWRKFSSVSAISGISAPTSRIDHFWQEQLQRVTRPSATALIQKLVPSNSLGYPGVADMSDKLLKAPDQSKIRVADLASCWKETQGDKVILVRMGDFYEAWGVDAVMLVEYAGLNPMGDSCRAGCPKSNIQQTLNSLTEAGLSIAVYEEATVAGSRSKKLRKERYLSQVVTPGRPVYLYDSCLKEGELPYREARPYGAIRCTKDGCSVGFIWVDSREVRVTEKITQEAVGSLIESVGGISDPVSLSLEGVTGSKFSSFLPNRSIRFPTNLSFDAFLTASKSDLCRQLAIEDSDFVITSSHNTSSGMNALHAPTAQFLGLHSSPGSADMMRNILPETAPFFCSNFFRRWLLSPPPREVSDCMRRFVKQICNLTSPVPKYTVVPVDKLVRLVESRNGNYHFYSDLHATCTSYLGSPRELLDSPDLHRVVRWAAGLSPADLEIKAQNTKALIEKSIFIEPRVTTYPESLEKFFSSKENEFVPYIRSEFEELELARTKLIQAVNTSLLNPEKVLIYDQVSGVLYVKDIDSYLRFGDAKKKVIPDDGSRKRHSTDMILKAEAEYRSAIEESKQRAKSHMKNLCREISENFLHALIFLSHWGVVVTSVYMHAESSIRKGWSLPSTTSDGCSIIDQVWPYWLELNRPAVANTVTLTDGHTAILTAPNMSGKSTLIRSIGAAILLGNAGLMAPCKSATVQEISDLIIVSPAGDRPSEGLSAFAAEADAMASAIKHSNSDNSVLLLVDEFGRGTSGRDAAALTTAVIKWLAQRNNVACVWATHLHELFTVPNLEVSWIQMDGFKLVSGQCVDSRGIDIAASHGFPDDVIKEARRHTQAEHTMPVELCPIERALKSVSCNMDDLVRLDTDCVLPPNLQAAHVLYILKMTSGALYVGETANLTQRLKAHYKKYQVGHVWVIPQANRTHARALESSLIRELLKEAVPLVSKTDGFKSQIASVTA